MQSYYPCQDEFWPRTTIPNIVEDIIPVNAGVYEETVVKKTVADDYLLNNDVSAIQTTVNAIFDRGYYSEITVLDAQSNILVTKTQLTRLRNVPDWFINFVDLEEPVAMREVASGWAITGDIRLCEKT